MEFSENQHGSGRIYPCELSQLPLYLPIWAVKTRCIWKVDRQISGVVLPACYCVSLALLIEYNFVSHSFKGYHTALLILSDSHNLCIQKPMEASTRASRIRKANILASQMISEKNELLFKDRAMWSGSWMHHHLWSKANRFPTGGLWGCLKSDTLVRTPLVLAL